MIAQDIYDYREETGAFSGNDLHALFSYLTDGEPSPSGSVSIDITKLVGIAAVQHEWRHGGDPTVAAREVLGLDTMSDDDKDAAALAWTRRAGFTPYEQGGYWYSVHPVVGAVSRLEAGLWMLVGYAG